ncbi:MAG: DUF5995 family protein [Bacteroidota bacterium]
MDKLHRTMQKAEDLAKHLSQIVAEERQKGGAAGYFAALYLRRTRAVIAGIEAGRFEDGPRLERMIMGCGARSLEAYQRCNSGVAAGKAWQAAFEAHRLNRVSIIQHLLLGINAHINLDLGIAAGEIAPGPAIETLRKDFDTINAVIAGLVDDIQDRLGSMSFPMRLLDRLAGTADESVANFSIHAARAASWQAARAYAHAQPGAERAALISGLDAAAYQLAQGIVNPGWLANLILVPVRWFEPADVGANIGRLL